ncbi:hypothetical protein ACFQI3_09130 [Hansschlegelia quercus]|uniref:Uncharacterized protein n=1 Tax=Hansschlegelia quercus TaxID=2528245 RepID=A0A4Q9GJ32_9HYPH|nr:hypothetical protein [Hansschlegelia quercus]TBN54243.1 hypothetical protein EYR15_05205 [Hansschlegelia quercus]
MFKYWAYVLIGNNAVGKTTIQKELALRLCSIDKFSRFDSNQNYKISNTSMPSSARHIFMMGRSFDEQNTTASTFFRNNFHPSDIAILSFHAQTSNTTEIIDTIRHLRRFHYNVSGVFFQNNQYGQTRDLAELDWDERLWIENPPLKESEDLTEDAYYQLRAIGARFATFLIKRSNQHCGEV